MNTRPKVKAPSHRKPIYIAAALAFAAVVAWLIVQRQDIPALSPLPPRVSSTELPGATPAPDSVAARVQKAASDLPPDREAGSGTGARFNTGDEVAAQEQAERAAKNEKYPLPLRSLVAVRFGSDHFDHAAYIKALNQFRDEPSAELLRQIVSQFSAGNMDFQSMFWELLAEGPFSVDVKKWEPEPRKAALRAGVEALSAAPTPMALEQALVRVLSAFGGGKVDFNIPSTDAAVNVSVDRTNSKSYSSGSTGITAENLAEVTNATQEYLRKMYPELWLEAK